MKAFVLNDNEICILLNVLKDDLENHFGIFDGEVVAYDDCVLINMDKSKYIEIEAIKRSILKFFETSKFNIKQFDIDYEWINTIEIRYKNNKDK